MINVFNTLANNAVSFLSQVFNTAFFNHKESKDASGNVNVELSTGAPTASTQLYDLLLLNLFRPYAFIPTGVYKPPKKPPYLLLCDIKATVERWTTLSDSMVSFNQEDSSSGVVVNGIYQTTGSSRVRFNSMESLQVTHFGEVIGEGGFSQVSRVRTASYDDAVLKRLDPSKGRMAKHEAEILMMMDHRNVVTFASAHRGPDCFALCFPTRYPTKLRDAKCDQYRSIFIQLTHAVEYIHGLNIIHRDIKPDNVMIDNEDVPILIDFGLAEIVQDRATTDCGTRGYMAPEMDGYTRYTNSVDIYSLAKTAENVYMFQGKKTFDAMFANPMSRPGIVGLRTLLEEFLEEFLELGESTRIRLSSGDVGAPDVPGPILLPRDLFKPVEQPGPQLFSKSLLAHSKSTISRII